MQFAVNEQDINVPLTKDADGDHLHLSFRVDPGDTSQLYLDITHKDGPPLRIHFVRGAGIVRTELLDTPEDVEAGAKRNEKRNADDLQRIEEARAKLDDPETPALELAEHKRLADMAPPPVPPAPETDVPAGEFLAKREPSPPAPSAPPAPSRGNVNIAKDLGG
jgi:hypothetical protein